MARNNLPESAKDEKVPPVEDGAVPVESNKGKKRKEKKVKPPAETVELPMAVELAFTVSALLLVLVNIAVIVISVASGAGLVDIFIRSLATTVGLGILLWLFSWQFSTAALQGAMKLQQEEMERMIEEQRAMAERAQAEAEQMFQPQDVEA